MAMAGLLSRLRHPFGPPDPVVPVLRLTGVISAGRGMSAGLSLQSLAEQIDKAFAIKAAPAVALAINSPGGSPVQSALIAKRIRDLAAEKQKPVLAFVAASGGYWLACAGDEIFADASSIVGSIGVISAGFGLHEAIARIGVERRVHTAGTRKSMLDPFAPERADDVARLQALQAEVHESFKAQVRARRGAALEKAGGTDLFTGEFWTGAAALDLGLVDGLGDLRSVVRARFGDKVRLRPIAQRQGLLRRLRPGLAGGHAPAEMVDGVVTALEERLLWQRFGL